MVCLLGGNDPCDKLTGMANYVESTLSVPHLAREHSQPAFVLGLRSHDWLALASPQQAQVLPDRPAQQPDEAPRPRVGSAPSRSTPQYLEIS